MFDSRASLPNEVRADIEKFLANARGTNSAWAQARLLPTFIRRNIKLAEAPSYGQTIFEYEPNCHGAEDYKKIADFINDTTQQTAVSHQQTPPIEIKSIPHVETQSPQPETTQIKSSQETPDDR